MLPRNRTQRDFLADDVTPESAASFIVAVDIAASEIGLSADSGHVRQTRNLSKRAPRRSPGLHRLRWIELLVLSVPRKEKVFWVGKAKLGRAAVQLAQDIEAYLVQRWIAPSGGGF
jgi:hypothetical protein